MIQLLTLLMDQYLLAWCLPFGRETGFVCYRHPAVDPTTRESIPDGVLRISPFTSVFEAEFEFNDDF
jgi:hypothetical protein